MNVPEVHVTVPDDVDLDEPIVPSASRLWTGGIATAVVAALVVVAGVFIARGILNVPVLAPKEAGTLGNSSTAVYAGLAAASTLVATALLQLLLLEVPRPITFFFWMVSLATIIVAAAPFTQPAPLASQVFTAVINLVTGIAVISLLSGVARSAIRSGRPSPRDNRAAGVR